MLTPHNPRSRLAPTPSGYLHLGNAYNLLLTWLVVRLKGGVLLLRIDDFDPQRCLPHYVEDIFHTLEWLGITWDLGPENPQSFWRDYSIQTRKEEYRQKMLALWERHIDALYACDCSRKQLERLACGCQKQQLPLLPGHNLLRVVDAERNHPVVWRRDDSPSYQLSSLLDDAAWEISLIIRGEDLRACSGLQQRMAERFGFESLSKAQMIHHPLLVGAHGEKLSKSRHDGSLKTMRESGVNASVILTQLAAMMGLGVKHVSSSQELLERVRELEVDLTHFC